jgi:small conductance mechanosensitive channel
MWQDVIIEKIQQMINQFISTVPNIVLALVVIVIFYFISRGLKLLIIRLTVKRQRHYNLGLVIGRLGKWLILFIGLLIAIGIVFPSVNASSLIGLMGLSGVLIGFAFRDILENFVAGILLLLIEPFRINDQIVIDKFEGTVENIEARFTSIKTYDGRRVIIPNIKLFTNSVIVNTAYESRRLEYDITIGYGDDISRAKVLILEAINSVDGILKDPPPDVLVVDLAASTVNIRARWWIRPPRRIDTLISQDKVLAAIKNNLIANGIDLPFETYQVLFHDQTEETDGDRSHQREGWPAGKGTVPRPRVTHS